MTYIWIFTEVAHAGEIKSLVRDVLTWKVSLTSPVLTQAIDFLIVIFFL